MTRDARMDSTVPNAVSVVMPVRNEVPYLHASIESILAQSYRDFEFVILDDASDDGSWAELVNWRDKDDRIRLERSKEPLGLSRSSNEVVRASKGSLVARMDGDDVAHPDRLAAQVAAFDADPDLALVGSLADGIDSSGRRVRPIDASRALRTSSYPPFPHGSGMFRRKMFDAVGGYRAVCEGWEDVDLFLRLADAGKVVTIVQSLYSYRFHSSNSALTEEASGRLRRFELERRSLAAHSRKGSYEDVLAEADSMVVTAAGRLHAYNYRGAVSLWSGGRFSSLKDAGTRLTLEAGRAAAVRSLINSTWGRVAPSSLRAALRTCIRVKDRVARLRLGSRNEVEWVTGR